MRPNEGFVEPQQFRRQIVSKSVCYTYPDSLLYSLGMSYLAEPPLVSEAGGLIYGTPGPGAGEAQGPAPGPAGHQPQCRSATVPKGHQPAKADVASRRVGW